MTWSRSACLLLLIACGGHASPKPSQEDTMAAQIARVSADLDDAGSVHPTTNEPNVASMGLALPPSAIRQVVMQHQSALRHCYDAELAHEPTLAGRVTMAWVIATDGSVSNAWVSISTIHNANVENCVLAEVKSWTFPRNERPSHVAAYPFKFGFTR